MCEFFADKVGQRKIDSFSSQLPNLAAETQHSVERRSTSGQSNGDKEETFSKRELCSL